MKKLMAIILTIAIVMSLCVVPASAAGSGVTITITPDQKSVDTATGDVIVTYTVKAKVTDPNLKVGSLTITLDPSAGLTLAEKTKKNDSAFYYEANSSLFYHETFSPSGIFEAKFDYAPKTKTFVAAGTTQDRNLNSTHGEIVLMTIMGKIAKGTTGSVTLKTTQHSYGDPGGSSASVDCDVTPATVTIAKAPISSVTASVEKPVAGQALDISVDLGGATAYTGTVKWYVGETEAAEAIAKPNTKYTAKITLTAGSGESFADSVTIPAGYTKVSNNGTKLVLTKTFDATGSLPAATVDTAPTAMNGLKYNGSEQVLLGSVGIANGGTMQYSLDNSSWSAAIPTGKDAKTYTVYYKAVGNSGYSDSAVANIQVTIGQKDISGVTIDPIPDQTYTGNAITPDPVVTDGTTPLVKGTDYTVSYTNNKNAGTATLTINGKGNYTGTTTANFTIDPATQTLTVPGSYNVAFNKTLDLNTICSSNAPGATLTFALAPGASMPSGTTFDAATGKVTAGNYTGSFEVTVDSAAVPNYKAALKGRITVYIVTTPAASVTAAPTAKTGLKYNGNDQALVSKGTANGGTMQYSLDNSTWSNEIPKGKDAGNYTVYYKVKGDSDHIDYTPASNTVSVSIAPKELQSSDLEKSGGSATKVYDGTATSSITVRVRASSLYGTDTLSINGSAVYNSANVSDANKITFTPTAITTGNYRLAATEVLTINNAKITAKDVKLTGGINATDRSYVKDNKTVNLTKGALTFTGLVSGETLDVNIPATGTISDAKVGTYNVTYSGVTLKDGTGKASNYKLVSPLPTVTVNITQALTPTAPTGLTGVKGNKLVSVALPAGWSWANPTQEMTTDGSQTFTANYTDPEGNYAPGTGISVHVDVKAKTDVSTNITFPNGSLVYNGHGQEYKKATISGIIAGDTPSWTYTYAVDSSTTATLNSSGLPLTVGKYKVTAIYEDSANYGTATATLEITPAKPTGTPTFTKITEKGKTLADANLGMGTLTPTGGTLDWVDGNATVVEANKAYEWKYTPADTDNYAPVTGTIVVYPVSTGIVIYSPCYTIKATAGANGTISPAGWCSVVENGSQTFTFTPDKGYTVAKVLVDGKSVGAVKSYTFKNVTKDHTIEVIFMKSNGNPATGVFVMP